jgi:ABC-type Mn2+/Zn2+ transport system ATPase subunit
LTCYNLGIDGYPLAMQLARYRLYREYNEKPEVIVQSLDSYSLNDRADLYMNNQFLPYLNEGIVHEAVEPYHYFHWYDYYLPLVRYRGKVDLIGKGLAEFLHLEHFTNGKVRGYQAQDREWSDEFDRWKEQHPEGVEQVYLQRLVDELDAFLADCRRDGIMVVLVYPPEYGQARDMVNNRGEIFAIYRDLADKYQVEFLDYSYDAMADDTKYFYNSQHLNKLGSELFSAKLAERLAGLVRAGAGELGEVSVCYGERVALDRITLAIPQGGQVAVVGPNGAGKSTLFRAVMGLVSLRSGEILLDGRPPSEYREPVAYVPQREEVDWRFPVTVFDVVAMGCYGRGRWLKRLSAADRELVHESLDRLGIVDLAQRPIGELSGGQQQRVFLARPLQLLAGLKDRAVTVLVSTHDLDLASGRFDQVILLNRRLVSAGSPEQVFTEEHLQAAFGGQMVVVNGRAIVVDQCCGGHGPVGGVDACRCDTCDEPDGARGERL